jgi:UDP-N-acetylmuramate--alanine ligase
VEVGHEAHHLDLYKPDALVISSAIPPGNPEVKAAEAHDIPVYKRADILSLLMAEKVGIAVAGTHGKTTTTAMIAHVLTVTGFDPTFIIGGVSQDLGTNARAGEGRGFVIEADEYDGMFLGLRPKVAVLTTLEMDHPDMFTSLGEVRKLFGRFLDRVPRGGVIIGGYDAAEARKLLKKQAEQGVTTITYGTRGGDWRALSPEVNLMGGMSFVARHAEHDDNLIHLRVPGVHNVQNAIGALAASVAAGVNPGDAAAALCSFTGVGRRFEVKGEVRGVTVIDDYAHHPTAIAATLRAAQGRYPNSRIWAVWEPHTFSRVAVMPGEFAAALSVAEHVIVTDVFRSRDTDDYGITPQGLVDRMVDHPDARHISSFEAIIAHIVKKAKPGDVVLVMSAGEATQIATGLVDALSHEE